MDIPVSPDAILLSYLAGVIDSEGYIGIVRTGGSKQKSLRPQLVLRLRCGMKEALLCNLLQEMFGGTITFRPQPLYDWQVHGPKAARVLEALLPYMRLKVPQAEIALKFQATRVHKGGGSRRTVPQEIVDMRWKLRAELEALHGHQGKWRTTRDEEIVDK